MRAFVSENTNTITVITYRNSAFPQLNVVFEFRNVSQIKILKKILETKFSKINQILNLFLTGRRQIILNLYMAESEVNLRSTTRFRLATNWAIELETSIFHDVLLI